jgi:acyl carrier protein
MSGSNLNRMTQILDNHPVDAAIRNLLGDKLGIDAHLIHDNMSFRSDLGIDSLDFIEIITEIEKKFQFKFLDEEMENLATVESLILHVKKNNR